MSRVREGARVPAPLLIPAAIGVLFLTLPLAGLLIRTPWSELGTQLEI